MNSAELKRRFESYQEEEYKNESDLKYDYTDIGEIGLYIDSWKGTEWRNRRDEF